MLPADISLLIGLTMFSLYTIALKAIFFATKILKVILFLYFFILVTSIYPAPSEWPSRKCAPCKSGTLASTSSLDTGRMSCGRLFNPFQAWEK
jgi:hypothetical protein